jgi:hypothetical protein
MTLAETTSTDPAIAAKAANTAVKQPGPGVLSWLRVHLLITWFLSTCMELVLMPAIIVGQNIQKGAADARSAKSFEDTEVIVDRLDEHTAGVSGRSATAWMAWRQPSKRF